MALSFRSASSVGPSQPWIPVDLPAGADTGDLLMAFQWLDNDGSMFNMSAPSGWVQEASIGNTQHGFAKIWSKRIDNILAEPTQYQFGGTSGADGLAVIVCVTGVTSLSTIDITTSLAMNGTTSPHFTPAASADDTDDFALIFGAGVVSTSCTWGIPGGYTNRGLSLTQSTYMQGIVASVTPSTGVIAPQSITTTAWNALGFGDITGSVVIGQSVSGAGAINAVVTAGVVATATILNSSILPVQRYKYYIDWNGDGTFTATGDDVSQRVDLNAVTIEYGRDQARALAPMRPGAMTFSLTNISRDYSPENASSPLAGLLNPARPNLVTVTWQGTVYTLWRGHLDDFDIDPTPGNRRLAMTAVDALNDLNAQVYTPLYRGVRSGVVVGYILDAIGWPSGKRDIDPGASIFPYWWEEGTGAWEALQKVVQSEGPPAFVTIDAETGNIVYRDRHHRILRPASTTSQVTIRDGGADPRFSWPLAYSSGWRDLINTVTFSVSNRAPIDADVIWQTDDTFNFTAHQVISVIAVGSDPFMNASITIDPMLMFGSVQVTLSRTSGQSAQIVLTEKAGAPAIVVGLRLMGNGLPASTSTQVNATDSSSVGAYGVKTYPNDNPWCNVYDAQAVADIIVKSRAQRLPTLAVRLTGGNSTIMTQQFIRDLSDRVTIVDAETGFNGDVFIEQIKHSITGAGNRVHETVFGCEAVPPAVDNPSTVFIFGSATNGKFGTNVFGH